ncbi:hypothetical protein [Flavobacterium adhaerens]|uniref:hypothetical protein n=1 Tax=Flavobacterium adhaerens TaxID=3149043 RepID=UPI0032B4A353
MVEIIEEENILNFNSIDVFLPFLNKCKNIKVNDTVRFPFNNKGKRILYLEMSLAIYPPINDNDSRVKELNILNKNE